jgi:glycosyltransferase involved in cell wall biosynthesis
MIWGFNNILGRFFLKNKHAVFIHGCLHPSENKKSFLKTLKKKIYWKLIEEKNLRASSAILLTSSIESDQLKKTFVDTGKIKKKLIRYGIIKTKINKKIALKKFNIKFPYLYKKNFFLYIGRIHSQKKCETIIKAVNLIKNNFKNKILIIGPSDQLSYKDYLIDLIKRYNLENQIFISKPEFGIIKWGAILSSKAIISSSQGENFGISFVEALSQGKPVLTTYNVNIFREILKSKAGLISKGSVKDFSEMLLKFSKLKKAKMMEYEENAKSCFKKFFDLNGEKNSLLKYLQDEVT